MTLHLEKVDVSIRVAEAEHVLLLGMLRNSLDDAVLGQEGVARRQLLLRRAFTVSFIEQQCAPWKGKEMLLPCDYCRHCVLVQHEK